MSELIRDLRYAFRILLKHPSSSAIVVITLALGIGATTAIFSIVNAIVFRPLPYAAPSQLVGVWTRDLQQPASQYPSALPTIRDWQQQAQTMTGIAAYSFNRFHVTGAEGTDETRGVFTTTNFFDVLGVQPALGRALQPTDEHDHVLLLSDQFWQRRYHGDRNVIGKTINLNAESFTIIGVMPSSFRFPTPDIEVWSSLAPVYKFANSGSGPDWINSRSLRGYRVVGRLRDGVSTEQGQAEMSAIAERQAQTYPESDAGTGVVIVPLRDQMIGQYRRPLIVLLSAVGFILLIACVNVANLMMTRMAARDREIAIRRALGAGHWRMVRQMLTESVLLGTIGGFGGLVLATWGVRVLLAFVPKEIPRLEGVGIDRGALLFAAAISIGTGILVGLAPAWRARKPDLTQPLREGGRGVAGLAGVKRIRGLLAIAEVALALMLLIGSGLFLRSFQRLTDVGPGFEPGHLLTMAVALQFVRYQEPAKQVAFFNQALQRIRSTPGVIAAGACTSLPPNQIQQSSGFTIEGRPAGSGQPPSALFMPATPGYLEALGLPLLRGRTIAESDDAAAPGTVVINQTLARSFFPDDDPLKHRLAIDGVTRNIVGIVGDAKYEGLGAPAGPQVYVPYAQATFPAMRIVVRTSVEPTSLIASIRSQIQSIDSEEGPTRIATMTQLLADSVAQPRFNTFLIGLFAALAFMLSAIGVYGVISYDVAQRTSEIGLRMALGARTRDVLRLILTDGLRLAFGGLIVGIAGALLLNRFLTTLLFEVKPTDLLTYIAASSLLMAVAIAACLIPARRATKVDPLAALRYE